MSHQWSLELFNITFFAYMAAAFNYIGVLVSQNRWIKRTATWIVLAGLTAHTAGLVARWIEAGRVEVTAFEAAVGHTLSGWAWFEVFVQHPPFTNLYESLVFFSWGMMSLYVIGEYKFKLKVAGVFATALALTTLGLASLSPGREIEPLVPALQSWWLHFHVIFASVAYPCFLLAAVLGFFYLLKDNVRTEALGAVLMTAFAVLLFAAGKGGSMFTGNFTMTLMAESMGKMQKVFYSAELLDGGAATVKNFPYVIPIAPVAYAMAAAFVLCAIAAAAYYAAWHRPESQTWRLASRSAMVFATAGLAAITATIVHAAITTRGVSLDQRDIDAFVQYDITRRLGGETAAAIQRYGVTAASDLRLTLQSSPYIFSLSVLMLLIGVFFAGVVFFRERFEAILPAKQVLDNAGYKTIMVGFPLMALLLMSGAVWAHYSWGRYWGWDPKETWALITWFVYAGYLHARMTRGWVGRRAAIIQVAGFAIVIFTYLGVNLGLTGEGLHSYGAG